MLLWYWLEMPLRTILATGDARKYALLNKSLAGFWFIGSYKDGDRLLAAVAADLGIPPGRRERTRPGNGGTGSLGGRCAKRTVRRDSAGRSGRTTRSTTRCGRGGAMRGSELLGMGPSRGVSLPRDSRVRPREGLLGMGVMRRRTRLSRSGARGSGGSLYRADLAAYQPGQARRATGRGRSGCTGRHCAGYRTRRRSGCSTATR